MTKRKRYKYYIIQNAYINKFFYFFFQNVYMPFSLRLGTVDGTILTWFTYASNYI